MYCNYCSIADLLSPPESIKSWEEMSMFSEILLAGFIEWPFSRTHFWLPPASELFFASELSEICYQTCEFESLSYSFSVISP